MVSSRVPRLQDVVKISSHHQRSRFGQNPPREYTASADLAITANAREATLRKEVSQLKRVLAEKVLEVDFFKGALHTVEARRQRNGTAGAQASTPTSGT